MSLPLEDVIMEEIGLGNHYNWYNGSGSCEYIRREAAMKLQGAIQKHHDAGEEIAPPNAMLMKLMELVSRVSDDSKYSLTNSWIVASYIIAEHIQQFNTSDQERLEAYKDLNVSISERFMPKRFNSR